ncbi:esterase AGAP003155-like [Coccinella septempunctata]|uniref:esterase AGAP003155-like n=1 Tax=Coccinella septempunctata TaxID=41139 RepID=UPI001D06E948|nr:esterase AGAP003155-like [Coccinella septempunctata]
MSADDKLKILALHGYRQNADIFKKITQPLLDSLSMWVKFVYVNAPHEVFLVDDPDNLDFGEKVCKKQYGWFFNRDNLTNRGIRNGGPAIGFQETVRSIESIFETYGPFDGILGFSQGACLAALLCDLQHRGLIKPKFNFAIIISGFKSKCLPHMKYFSDIISLPTMHILGDEDEIIPNEMSASLAECFEEPLICNHTGGHIVPTSPEQIEEYQKFVYTHYLSKNLS